MSLGRKVAFGAVWLIGARVATRALDLLAMLVIARILTPADFGLVALASTLLLVVDASTQLSLSEAIVQMPHPDKAAYDTAFTMNLARGLGIGLVLFCLAVPMAWIYADHRLVALTWALSFWPVLQSIRSPRMAHLQRELAFRQQFTVEAAGKMASFVASVTMALVFRSYWALIAGMLVAPAVGTVVSYVLAPYRPAFAMTHWRPIFSFSGWLTLSQAINTLNWQADRFLVGGSLGNAVLGQYAVGSQLASLPTHVPVEPMMKALYTGFARLAGDPLRLRTAYLKSQSTISALIVPIGLIVSSLAYPIIQLALGPKWGDAAYVVQILAPVYAIQMLTGPAHSAAMATGNTRIIFLRDLLGLVIRLPLILAGLYLFGLPGVVWARVLSGLALILLNLEVMRQIVGIPLIEQIRAPWRSLASGAIMFLIIIFAQEHINLNNDNIIGLLIYIASMATFGFVLYVAIHISLWTISGFQDGPERRLFDIISQIRHTRASKAS